MTQKEKEKIAMAGILTNVDCAVEGLKVDAKSIAEIFGKVIGAEFDCWFGAVDFCTAAFSNDKIFDLDDMLVVLTKLSAWVDAYGSLLALRCTINDWYDYFTDSELEERPAILIQWLVQHQPKGGER